MKHRSDRITLPVMECRENCGACCGPVLCKDFEFQRVTAFAAKNGLSPVAQGITCPWYQGGKCTVYPVRPFACRMFGHVPRMECKHGFNTNVSRQDERRLVEIYKDDGGPLDRMLHEALGYGWGEEIKRGEGSPRSVE
jgi:hypothetical protein